MCNLTQIEDTEPLPRWGHLAITVGSKVFVWGGEGSTKQDREFLRLYDMKAKKWWKRKTKGTPPQGYTACAYTLIGKVLYVFGGSNGPDYYNDVYQVELDLKATTLEWKKCKVQNKAPMGKRSTGMIARKTEDNSDELLVFGGYGKPYEETLPGSSIHRTNEVHTFNIATGEWTAVDFGSRKTVPMWDSFTFTKIDDNLAVVIAGVQQGPGAVNSVYCLQLNESATTDDPEWSWVRVATTGEKGVPSERRDHATILLGTTQDYIHLFMTGGIDKKWHSLGDAWILNLKREEGKIKRGSWIKVVGQDHDLQLKAANTADSAPDSAEPLKPRYSLTANKCESNGSEQCFHLMVFGGIFKSKVSEVTLAETTVLTLACTYAENAISSGELSVYTPS